MELKVYRDAVEAAGVLCDAMIEIPLETEILIPDYLPAVFKIVKTIVHKVVLQKQMQAGHLLIEGYFRIEVFYQGEDQQLCSVEQKVAFSRQQDIRCAEDATVCLIELAGETQYINCRAVSQHRLDLRGAYNLRAHVLGDRPLQLITALAEGGIQQQQTVIPMLRLRASREKQFTLEEAFSFDREPLYVLRTQSAVSIQEARFVAGKAVIKGEVNAEIVYRSEESAQLCRQSLALPFHQVVELDGAQDGEECQAVVDPIGYTIMAQGNEGEQTRLSCTCLMTVRALGAMEAIGVQDCFSTQYQTEVHSEEIVAETLQELLSNTVDVRVEGALPDDSLEVLDCLVECFEPELFPEEEHTAVRGRIVAHLFCKNALGEIDCYDKPGEYILPKRYDIVQEELSGDLRAVCEKLTFSQRSDNALVSATLRVQGFLCKKSRCTVVEDVTCLQPLEKEADVCLRVYYAAADEEVFSIAKRYHASPQTICALAGIEGEKLQQSMRLLIPQG